jgi:hypothetical protein
VRNHYRKKPRRHRNYKTIKHRKRSQRKRTKFKKR